MTKTSLTPYVNVARIVRTHGRHGEVVVAPLDGLPFCLTEGMDVWLTPPEMRGPRRRRVMGVRGDEQQAVVALSGADGLSEAEPLVGKLVLVRREDVPEASRASDVMSAVGREVVDVARGPIGSVAEVMVLPANDVWRIEGGPYGEVLMPVIDDCVGEIPPRGPITVRLLPGLVPDEGDAR